MITVHINRTTSTPRGYMFIGYVRLDEDGIQHQVDGEFTGKIYIHEEFASELGDHCEEVVIDVTDYKPGTYTFE